MADFREVRHGYDILFRYFNDTRTKALIAAFEKSAPGAAQNALNAFNGWWSGNNALNIYVSSFSEHGAEHDAHGRLDARLADLDFPTMLDRVIIGPSQYS
jgi:hypothetical protein